MVTHFKARKLWRVLSCLLAALCLTGGLWVWQYGIELSYVENARPTEAPAVSTTMPIDGTPDTTVSPPAEQTDPPEPPQEEHTPTHSVMFRRIGAGLFLAAAGFTALFLALFRLSRPLLGPELETLLACLLAVGFLALFYQQSDDLLPRLLQLLLMLPLPVLMGGFVSWIRRRGALDWTGIHRMAAGLGGAKRPYRFYMPVLFLVCGATALCIGLLFPLDHPGKVVLLCWLLLVLGIAVACSMRYSRQSDRLQQKIKALHHGEVIWAEQGLFQQDEALLCQLQSQRDEAIRAAVVGERFKVELISNVSHDLRTPLTAILGYGELLQQEQLSAEGEKRLTSLNQKAGYMRNLVDSLFELTKVSSGAVEPNWEKLDLIRLLEQTIGLLDDQLGVHGLQVRRKYSADSILLATDGNRIHQVFANLLENAIKYALQGTRIYLTVTEQEKDVQVRITNTACYEMHFQPEEIVQRFARGDQARTTQGSGLGLAIVQTYTQSVGGNFQVEVDGDQFRGIVTLPKTQL